MQTFDNAHPDRATVLKGGLVGGGIGLGLLCLAVFFVFAASEPHEILGVFLPLAVAQIALSLGVMALVPLQAGDSTAHSPRLIATWLLVIAAAAVVLTIVAAVRADWPWVLFAVAPIAAAASLVRSALRFRSIAGA